MFEEFLGLSLDLDLFFGPLSSFLYATLYAPIASHGRICRAETVILTASPLRFNGVILLATTIDR